MNMDETEPVPEIGQESPKDPANGNLGETGPEANPAVAEHEPPSHVEDTGKERLNVDETGIVAETGSEPSKDPVDVNLGETGPEVIPIAADLEPPSCVEAPRKELHILRTMAACMAGALVPGLGHAVLGKWDRAFVFLGTLTVMFALGLQLHGRLFNPDFSDVFSALKFIADAGIGMIYWVSRLRGLGVGDPAAYTYDFANVFIYVAGLLNMLVIADAFDIAQERKP